MPNDFVTGEVLLFFGEAGAGEVTAKRMVSKAGSLSIDDHQTARNGEADAESAPQDAHK